MQVLWLPTLGWQGNAWRSAMCSCSRRIAPLSKQESYDQLPNTQGTLRCTVRNARTVALQLQFELQNASHRAGKLVVPCICQTTILLSLSLSGVHQSLAEQGA